MPRAPPPSSSSSFALAVIHLGQGRELRLAIGAELEGARSPGLVQHQGVVAGGRGERERKEEVSHEGTFWFWCARPLGCLAVRGARGGDAREIEVGVK